MVAAVLAFTTASASATAGAENRVRALAGVAEVLVEPPERITAGHRPGEAATWPETAAATGVAANAAARTPSVIRAGELKLAGVPRGSTGAVVRSGKGLQYQIPQGTPELDPRSPAFG